MAAKGSPQETARRFVQVHFAGCAAAILGGSAARADENDTSDLDLVIVDHTIAAPFHEIFSFAGWDVEVFAFCGTTYEDFFRENARMGSPTLQRICAEGIIIVDREGEGMKLKQKAKEALEQGPDPWSLEEMNASRYEVTDLMLDFTAAKSYDEAVFIANALARAVHQFILRVNGRWIGDGKWLIRELELYDSEICRRFVAAFSHFYRTGEKEQIVRFVDGVLAPYGGRLLAGYREESALPEHIRKAE